METPTTDMQAASSVAADTPPATPAELKSAVRRTVQRKAAPAKQSVPQPQPSVWSVAGGKGGTGKSIITANLGIGLALLGKRVILLDGDLGGPNLHNYLNLRRPAFTLNDFLLSRCRKLADVTTETPIDNLKVISGGTELLGAANLNHMKKEKLLRHLQVLDAEYVLVDLGAGTTFNTIDFFNASNRGIIIANPEPNAKYDAFFFLKNALFRKLGRALGRSSPCGRLLSRFLKESAGRSLELARFLEFAAAENPEAHAAALKILNADKLSLIMNKVRTRRQQHEGEWFANLVHNYLGVEIQCLGNLDYDEKVIASAENIVPLLFRYPKSGVARNLYDILDRLEVTGRDRGGCSWRQFRAAAKNQSNAWLS